MKKIFSIVALCFGICTFYGCMHECSCISVSDMTVPGRHEVYRDTLNMDSRDECSLMNMDTTFIILHQDTLAGVVDSGFVHETTLCE